MLPGAVHLKAQQDLHVPHAEHYIRKIIEITDAQGEHDEDEPLAPGGSNILRIVVCMSPEGSKRLLKAQYLSSDISFKRVADFYEFELACIDRESNTSETLHLWDDLDSDSYMFNRHCFLPCIPYSADCYSAPDCL